MTSSPIDSMVTLRGIPLAEAFARLDDVLPPEAYKPIQGGKGASLGLTDINPGFLPSVLLDLFGPLGVGWGFELKDLVTTPGKTSGGAPNWESVARLSVWYAYYDGDLPGRSAPAEFCGGSDNSEREWAEKGAMTNALGTAWFFMGYQISVYQGTRSHKTHGVGARHPDGAPKEKWEKKPAVSREKLEEKKQAVQPMSKTPPSRPIPPKAPSPPPIDELPVGEPPAEFEDLVPVYEFQSEGFAKNGSQRGEWVKVGDEPKRSLDQNAKIHALLHEMKIPDEEYRSRLMQYYGKSSSADLSRDEASNLIERLETKKSQGAARAERQERRFDRDADLMKEQIESDMHGGRR